MQRKVIFLALALSLASEAQAADLNILSPAAANGVMRKLAAAWTATSGVKVNIQGRNVTDTLAMLGKQPADLIVMPPELMAKISDKIKPGSTIPLPATKYGLAMKKGSPHPDVSSVEKFVAYLKASDGLEYYDPSLSASGAAVDQMLKRPEFAGVVAHPMQVSPGTAVAHGDALLAGGTVSEEMSADGAEVIATFPESLGMRLGFSVALVADAKEIDSANAFTTYIKSAAAKPIWAASGFESP